MMKNLNVLQVLILICLAIVCGYAVGNAVSASIDRRTPVTSCPDVMADIIQSAQGDVYQVDDPDYVEPKSYDLVSYSVSGDELTNPIFEAVPNELKDEQLDAALQREAWQTFASMIPPEARGMVTQYNVFTDGGENTLAAVDQVQKDSKHWIVEIDIADLNNRDAFLFTLVHEYAHLLTLNASQVPPDPEIFNNPDDLTLQKSKAGTCPNYFTGGGCSLPNSYIDDFYQRFWLEINPEWEKIDGLQYEGDLLLYYESLHNFYKSHQDQFVDDYATTHPAEDIAESFAYFVFSPRPSGNSIKEQKISFFYQYPELITLREEVLSAVCSAPPN